MILQLVTDNCPKLFMFKSNVLFRKDRLVTFYTRTVTKTESLSQWIVTHFSYISFHKFFLIYHILFNLYQQYNLSEYNCVYKFVLPVFTNRCNNNFNIHLLFSSASFLPSVLGSIIILYHAVYSSAYTFLIA